MIIEINRDIQNQIQETLKVLRQILKENLLAVYLYGSAVLGGLQKSSDIDLLVITSSSLTLDHKRKLGSELMKISYPNQLDQKYPLEVTVVEKSKINPWYYPPGFDFVYEENFRKDFEKGNFEPWPTNHMNDMAIIITQVLLLSVTLYGPKPSDLLDAVPYMDFINGMTNELDLLYSELDTEACYVILTLARIWCTLETDLIKSKIAAAEWAIQRLPLEHKLTIEKVRNVILDRNYENWKNFKPQLKNCADYLMDRIFKNKKEIYKDTKRIIKIDDKLIL